MMGRGRGTRCAARATPAGAGGPRPGRAVEELAKTRSGEGSREIESGRTFFSYVSDLSPNLGGPKQITRTKDMLCCWGCCRGRGT
jgi:hypothetical protein